MLLSLFCCQPVSTPVVQPIQDSEDTLSDNGETPSTSNSNNIPTAQRVNRRKTQSCRGARARQQSRKDVERHWSKVAEAKENANASIGYNEVSGPSRMVHLLESPIQFLMLFMTRQLIESFVYQTNLYCQQVNEGNKPNGWTELTYEEILAFIGLVIAMGLVKLPSVSDNWSTSGIFQLHWFPSIMSRDRFLAISKYFHCANNEETPERDNPKYKLHKVQAIIEELNKTFKKYYIPKQNLSIDEQMIGTKCRVSFIQYMPKKPKKFGIKVWALCESTTGYRNSKCTLEKLATQLKPTWDIVWYSTC